MKRENISKYLLAVCLVCAVNFVSANERIGTLMVELAYDNGYYSIQDTWVVNEIYPILTGIFTGSDALVFQLTDSEGNEISRIKVRDPSIIRMPHPQAEDSKGLSISARHGVAQKKRGSIVLRFPQYKKMRYINLLNSQIGQDRDNSDQYGSKPVKIQQMDLLNY
jgi:hypothetical protein